mmetsp:Transcript_40/g.66  ORF Transcript_40/g.66 Transcript_40/m.66 type:complete len:454 (+) Transcript_40:355-1716(+)
MKLILAALSLHAGWVSLAKAEQADICKRQNPCLDFNVTLLQEGDEDYDVCPTCTYKVCMTIDQDDESCKKSHPDEFSHTCEKDEATCIQTKGFTFATEVTEDTGDLYHGYTQCQLVPPNGVAEFLLKDGVLKDGETCNSNDMTSDYYFEARPVEYGLTDVTASCEDSPYPGNNANDCNPAEDECSCTSSGGECLWKIKVPGGQNSGCGGDPHFKRWGKERSSFHGECDLVLVHSEGFHRKAGFDLHARTTIDSFYSYIESAALRVGDYILELEKEQFFINDERHTKDELPLTFGGDFKYTITLIQDSKLAQKFRVDLHQDSHIDFKFYKHYLTISIDGHPKDFADATGMLGEYTTGDMYGRCGQPMDSFEEYGFEWQVIPDDPQLFHEARSPQMPYEKCRMPTVGRPARRRLRVNTDLLEQAKTACANQSGGDFDLCVDDIMITGDIGLAEAW